MRCSSGGSDVPTGLRFCGRCGAEASDPGSATVILEAEEQDPLLSQLRHVLAGEYEIERECGRGGMAAVFKALDVSLRRPGALKVMFPAAPIGGAAARRAPRGGPPGPRAPPSQNLPPLPPGPARRPPPNLL